MLVVEWIFPMKSQDRFLIMIQCDEIIAIEDSAQLKLVTGEPFIVCFNNVSLSLRLVARCSHDK